MIGLFGDYDESVTAHRAIPLAIAAAAKALNLSVDFRWIHSEEIDVSGLGEYSAIWCVPASPYKNTQNVLRVIEFARLHNIPFLGTCGGPLISGLSCKLYDASSTILLDEDSGIYEIYGKREISEDYFCGYGVNREYLDIYDNSELTFSGFDEDGDPRTLEIAKHKFFFGTAFQPERSALKGNGVSHPLITAYLSAALG